jgi:hypothetical protein
LIEKPEKIDVTVQRNIGMCKEKKKKKLATETNFDKAYRMDSDNNTAFDNFLLLRNMIVYVGLVAANDGQLFVEI